MADYTSNSKSNQGRDSSATAGGVDIIFRRPGSASTKNRDPKGSKRPGSRTSDGSAPGVKPPSAGALAGAVKVKLKGGTARSGIFSGGEDAADAALARALKVHKRLRIELRKEKFRLLEFD